ncbi:MAG TPA: DUF1674 domain-containing protein [Steroidobacteraceae bacterium]|jgi:hypothetical protein
MRIARGFSGGGLLADYTAMSSGNLQASRGYAAAPEQSQHEADPVQSSATQVAVSHNASRNTTGVNPAEQATAGSTTVAEIGGRDGPEPTRFGDWEKRGRCIDF